MKSVFALLFLCILFWQVLFYAGYLVYWKVNQDYITQKYCVNKQNTEMHCNGQCHLKKQLIDVESTPKKAHFPATIFKLKCLDNFIVENTSFDAIPCKTFYKTKISFILSNINFLLLGLTKSIDHPPELV